MVLLVVFAVGGCAGTEPRSGTPSAGPISVENTPSTGRAATPTPSVEPPPRVSVPSVPSVPSVLAEAGLAPAPVDAATFLECVEPSVDVRLPEDQGGIFDNALTTAESGHRDRTRPILDAIRNQKAAFRCCFAPWAASAPIAEARVLLRIELDAAGHVSAVGSEPQRTTVQHPTTLACLEKAIERVRFPPSPGGRVTVVEYPLRATLLR